MTAKDYLLQALWLDQRINSKLEYLESLKRISMKVTTSFTHEKPNYKTIEKSRMEDTIVKIIDLENEINADIDQLIDLKKNIMRTIKVMEDINCQVLIEMRYLVGKSWEDIACDLNYNNRTVFKLHGKALKEIEEIMKEGSKGHRRAGETCDII